MSSVPHAITHPPKVLAIVQAGGQGSRMDVLTRERAKPALPWGGTHQLIDFTLSNLALSGISDVWVSVAFLAGSLDEHLQSGRPWDLDRNRGGYRRLVPESGAPGEELGGGNADDLFRMRDEITRHGADVVVVSSADHVFAADLRPAIAAHLELGAALTLLTSEVPLSDAKHKVVVTTGGKEARVKGVSDADGSPLRAHKVTAIDEKPEHPEHGTVATEIFLYDRGALVEHLTGLHTDLASTGEHSLGDFAEHLLPRLVATGRTYAVPLPGYWKDVGRPSAYLQSHRDLVRGRAPVFEDPRWPILTNSPRPRPSRVEAGASVEDSLLAQGSDVRGEVVRSVLGPGVQVAAGARVVDSVLNAGVRVEAGAVVETAVIDNDVVIGRGARVGSLVAGRLADGSVTLVGRDCRIGAHEVVERGARLEPGTTV